MSTNSRVTNQLKAIVIFEFLNSYNKLEKLIRKHFVQSLTSLSSERINELHFIRGGLIGTNIVFNTPMELKLRENTFKANTEFGEFTINHILKMNTNSKIIDSFKEEIQSELTKNTFYLIEDSILKFLKMRNKIAHELMDCNFNSSELVEILSSQKMNNLNYEFLKGYDLNLMDDMTISILSNYFYMEKIIATLEVESST